ncbi:MAG TPA: hypothetical protein VJV79_18620 [Polyangiaceae bacterium]|nr:hypothetical protein [Polyangiaceae bacterium]
MKARAVVVGVLVVMGAWLSAGCAGEELVKWNCSECSRACAANEGDAKSASECTSSSDSEFNSCTPTGDICACPDGADKCAIIPFN